MKGIRGLLWVTCIFFLCSHLVFAGNPKYADNPDRYASLTFTGAYEGGSGDTKITDTFGISAGQDLSPSFWGLRGLFTAPVGNSVSLIGGFSYSSSKVEGKENLIFNDYENNFSTFSIAFGFKVYFIRH